MAWPLYNNLHDMGGMQFPVFRANDRPPCKSVVKKKARVFCTRFGERVVGLIRIACRARMRLG